jgi:tRNA pseudouridine55 synthase
VLQEIQLLDKPIGFSSFQIVRILKKHHKKVGHAGTLDPCASGLLIMLIGKATRKFNEIQNCEKHYTGDMILSVVTDTYDISGRIIERMNKEHLCSARKNIEDLSIKELNHMAEGFVGEIEQVPPRFSAIKKDGRKLYELSRHGKEVQPEKRKVYVKSFRITYYDYPVLKFDAIVGKGVYIRSLVYDFGNRMGCGATLLSLRRTQIGNHRVDDARKLGEIL